MTFRINKSVPLTNAALIAQINTARSEVTRARALQHEAKQAWRNDEEAKQGYRAAWFEDQMNAALDALATRILPPAAVAPPSFEYPPTGTG